MATDPMDVRMDAEDEPMEHAEANETVDPEEAVKELHELVFGKEGEDRSAREKARALLEMGTVMMKNNMKTELEQLIEEVKPFLESVSKAKGGHIFKTLIENYCDMDAPTPEQKVKVCQKCIDWAISKNRNFLRQALEVRLIFLHLDAGEYQNCLAQIDPLLKELKRLDDKQLLVEVHLMESRALYSLSNYPKARAALVSAKTAANAIYCPPKMQASIDFQSGILHSQEKDFKTAYSYFYEAFEGYDSVELRSLAIRSLKYMLLGKILLKEADDIPAIVTGKLALKYSGRDIEAMQAVGKASLKRSLELFEEALQNYIKELKGDAIIASHLADVYDSFLEQNLLRVVEPFSKVEIEHVAVVMKLPLETVEKKLSQMILDKQLNGILDQGKGYLELYEESEADKTFESSLQTMAQMNTVVDALYKKAQLLL